MPGGVPDGVVGGVEVGLVVDTGVTECVGARQSVWVGVKEAEPEPDWVELASMDEVSLTELASTPPPAQHAAAIAAAKMAGNDGMLEDATAQAVGGRLFWRIATKQAR